MKKRLLAFGLLLLSVLLGIGFTYLPERNLDVKPISDFKLMNINESRAYLLKDYKGKLAIFIKGRDKPEIIFSVFTDNLPDIDKFKLKEGIEAQNYQELLRLIEDYTN